jgi:hypothetical protein
MFKTQRTTAVDSGLNPQKYRGAYASWSREGVCTVSGRSIRYQRHGSDPPTVESIYSQLRRIWDQQLWFNKTGSARRPHDRRSTVVKPSRWHVIPWSNQSHTSRNQGPAMLLLPQALARVLPSGGGGQGTPELRATGSTSRHRGKCSPR